MNGDGTPLAANRGEARTGVIALLIQAFVKQSRDVYRRERLLPRVVCIMIDERLDRLSVLSFFLETNVAPFITNDALFRFLFEWSIAVFATYQSARPLSEEGSSSFQTHAG